MSNNINLARLSNGISKIPFSPESKSEDLIFDNFDNESKNLPKEIIPACLTKLVQSNPSFPVLKYKSNPSEDHYDQTLTMQQYLDSINNVAKSFITLGLDAKSSIGILGFNHPSWFLSQLGGIFAGGLICGIYTTNNAEICKYIMNDCSCQFIVVENDEQTKKILSIISDVPQLKAIIKYTGTVSEDLKNQCTIPIYTWDQFIDIKNSNAAPELEKRLENMKPSDPSVLIYTSGTTGFPKGVMLSHDNILFTVKMAMKHLGLHPFSHSLISYLPLSHIAANVVDIMSTVSIGTTIYFAQPDALKGSLGKTLKEVRPTLFIGVPRVFEKIQEQMQEIGAKSSGLRRYIASWAKSVGYRNSMARISGKPSLMSYCVANCLVFSKVKEALGLDRCEYLASAAAPLTQQTTDYFLSLDMTIHQIYGMSECCGPHTLSVGEKIKLGSSGTLLKGTELKIAEPNENNIGEICMRGRHVFMGYYNAEEKTRETIDSEGWLHSGDLGKMEDKCLFITGRIKELIITAGGENIVPIPIEDKIKERIQFVSNVMLVGDKQKFISCVLTLKTNIDPETQCLTDILTPAAVRSLNTIGIQAKTVQEVLNSTDTTLKNFIDQEIKKVNETSVSKAAYVQKWAFLPKDFSINGGELGPTMKLKRMVIVEMYSDVINKMYNV